MGKVYEPEAATVQEADQLEVARGVLTDIEDRSLLDMIGEGEKKRKFSLGSETDPDLSQRSSFASKTVKQEGDTTVEEKKTIGFACKKGLKPESPNQDSWFVIRVEGDFSIYGVFDGHGAKGHDISDFVRTNFPKILVNSEHFHDDPLRALKDTYEQVQQMIEIQTKEGALVATFSGSTVSVILHRHSDEKIFVSHVGDSRCVLGRRGDTSQNLTAIPLTADHKPENPEEKERIEKNGGRVVFDGFTNHRVYAKGGAYPGLNMSRALGDLMGYYDAGISAEPSLKEMQLKKGDDVLMMCSDGVWEFLSDSEVWDIVHPLTHGPNRDAQKAAERLAKEAWDQWMKEEEGLVVDDITVLIAVLD